jgi:hypothetical protein
VRRCEGTRNRYGEREFYKSFLADRSLGRKEQATSSLGVLTAEETGIRDRQIDGALPSGGKAGEEKINGPELPMCLLRRQAGNGGSRMRPSSVLRGMWTQGGVWRRPSPQAPDQVRPQPF